MWGLILLLSAGAAVAILVGAAGIIWALVRPPRVTYAVAVARDLPLGPEAVKREGEAVTFSLRGGADTPGWVLPGDDPDGPTVVFVHGYNSGRYLGLAYATRLVPHADRVVFFDLPGAGESKAKWSSAGINEHRDVRAVLDQLPPRADGGDARVVLFGSSMGGGIAIAAAAEDNHGDRPGRVVGVIAQGTYRRPAGPIRQRMRNRRMPAQPIVWLVSLFFRLTHPGVTRFDRAAHAARLRCPLLLLHGSDDPICPIGAAREIAAAADDAEIVAFEGGGHAKLAWDFKPEFRAALAGFFDKLRRRRGGRAAESPGPTPL